jgi:hypothetical protein
MLGLASYRYGGMKDLQDAIGFVFMGLIAMDLMYAMVSMLSPPKQYEETRKCPNLGYPHLIIGLDLLLSSTVPASFPLKSHIAI